MPKCEACDREFSTDEAFQQHQRDKHGVGKEAKKEKQEKKEIAAPKFKKKRSKKPVAYVVVVLIIVGLIYFAATSLPQRPKVSLGALGSTHIHQDFRAYIDGTVVDFGQPKYQLQSQYTHFEGGDGNVLHVHATGITLAYMLDTLRMRANATCITVDKQYCSNNEKTLRFIVNNDSNPAYIDYVMNNLDKILIYYGQKNETLVQEQIALIPDKVKLESATPGLPSHVPR